MSPEHSQILINTAWMAPLGKTNISIASSTKALVMFLSLQSYHKHAELRGRRPEVFARL